MKTKTILLTVFALCLLIIGTGCERANDNVENCYYCAQSDFIKKIENVTGIIIYYEEINRYIISINEQDINNLDIKKWNSISHSSEYIYIPYTDLPKQFKKNGLKVTIIKGELFSCYPTLPMPNIKIRFVGQLLKNYKIERK